MNKRNKIRYRSLMDGTKPGEWQVANSLDEFNNYNYYIVELTHSNNYAGLPIEHCADTGHYIVAHLLVTDQGTHGLLQQNRVIGQTLILSDCITCIMKIFTRTCSGMQWSSWEQVVISGNSETPSNINEVIASLTALIADLKAETARAQSAEQANAQAIEQETRRATEAESLAFGGINSVELRNGSVGNFGNDYCVAQKYIYSIEQAKYIMFYTNRPNSENCVYRYVYGLYNVNSGLVGSVSMCSGFDNYNSVESERLNILEITDSECIGFAFGITEWNTVTKQIVPLRVVDFRDYSTYIINVDNESLLAKLLYGIMRKTVSFESYSPIIGNGTYANSGNKYGIRNTTAIPVNHGDIVTIEMKKVLDKGHYFTYGFGGCKTSATTDIGSNRTEGYFYDSFPDCKSNSYIVSSKETKYICVNIAEYDSNDTLLSLRSTDFEYGDLIIKITPVESYLMSIVQTLISKNNNSVNFVLERNKEREQYLIQLSHFNKISQGVKDFQFCLLTDTHQDALSESNSVVVTNSFKTIDALIHCGDVLDSYYVNSAVSSFIERMKKCEKPFYVTLGNHDVGNGNYIGKCCNHQQAYNAFIKPMIDKGCLLSGEYVENECYWFHDFAKYKIRLIALYEFDNPLELDETNWKAIPYDNSLPEMALSTFYSSGSKINVKNYNGFTYSDYSFEAVSDITTPANLHLGTKSNLWPGYKTVRGFRLIRQEQAEWFLDTLATIPENYSVIVALHNPFSDVANTVPDYKFCQSSVKISGGDISQNYMLTDFVANAISAFINGENYSEKIVMKGDAEYLNTLSDSDGTSYYYGVTKDFGTKNGGAKFAFLIGGHAHRDLIWKHPTYNIYQISAICATTSVANSVSNDVCRSQEDGLTKDCLTIVTANTSNRSVGLAKIGTNVTINAEKRDLEIISLDS